MENKKKREKRRIRKIMARQTDKVSYRADSRRKWKKRDIINIKSRNFDIFI